MRIAKEHRTDGKCRNHQKCRDIRAIAGSRYIKSQEKNIEKDGVHSSSQKLVIASDDIPLGNTNAGLFGRDDDSLPAPLTISDELDATEAVMWYEGIEMKDEERGR